MVVQEKVLHGWRQDVPHPLASVLRQAVTDLEIDLVGRRLGVRRPGLLDEVDDLGRDLEGEMVVPPVREPVREFLRGIVVLDVDVQFEIPEQPRIREVG